MTLLSASTDREKAGHMHVSSAPPPTSATVPQMRRIASAELMAGHREIVILHDGQEYRLRVTNSGKLILTK